MNCTAISNLKIYKNCDHVNSPTCVCNFQALVTTLQCIGLHDSTSFRNAWCLILKTPCRADTANQQWINGSGCAHQSLQFWKVFQDSRSVVVSLMLQPGWVSHHSKRWEGGKDAAVFRFNIKSVNVRNARLVVCSAKSWSKPRFIGGFASNSVSPQSSGHYRTASCSIFKAETEDVFRHPNSLVSEQPFHLILACYGLAIDHSG